MKHHLFNPYLPPYEYIPDGEPRVFGDRLYLYGSHDKADNPVFCVGDYVVWSAPCEDLSDWHCEGVSYARTADPHNADGKRTLFAPDVVQGKDGYYYLYYCLSFLEEFGVARAKRPQGPFTFYGHVRYPDGRSYDPYFPYDPSVLVEEDGRVFLYYGFSPDFTNAAIGSIAPSPGCMVVELEPDMLTVKGEARMCVPGHTCYEETSFSREHAYFEAPSMRKIGERYYLVYSSQSHHELCYAISQYPDREFTYGGVILSNGNIGYQGQTEATNYTGNNHGGLAEIKGNWYLFYHRHTHAISSSRQGCAERVAIEADGRIRQVSTTSYGLRGEPLPGIGEYPAYIACYIKKREGNAEIQYGKDYKATEPYLYEEQQGERYEHYLANLMDGVTWGFREFALQEPKRIVLTVRAHRDEAYPDKQYSDNVYQNKEENEKTVEYSSGKPAVEQDDMAETSGVAAEGMVLVYIEEKKGSCVATLPVKLSGSRDWVEISGELTPCSGVYGLYFTYQGKGALQCKGFRLEA